MDSKNKRVKDRRYQRNNRYFLPPNLTDAPKSDEKGIFYGMHCGRMKATTSDLFPAIGSEPCE
jgi:hypothetical protein